MEPRMEGAGLEYCFSLQCGGASGAFHGACSGKLLSCTESTKGTCSVHFVTSKSNCPI